MYGSKLGWVWPTQSAFKLQSSQSESQSCDLKSKVLHVCCIYMDDTTDKCAGDVNKCRDMENKKWFVRMYVTKQNGHKTS